MGLTNDLKHRLTVLNLKQVETETGDTDYEYAEDGRVWGGLSVVSGRTETLPGDMERANVTHRLLLRRGACRLATSTRFLFRGQRYDVLYWQPHYKLADRVEVLLKLVIEDG